MTDVTGSTLADALCDRYTLERELGRGGMATVYLAHDLRHDRPVALKVLDPALGAALGTDRFLREIRLTARLEHPHILPVFDSGEVAGHLWYTMPYIEGESLQDRLGRDHRLPLDEALRITLEVAEALGYAHAHGVVHRDIKPGNVMLDGRHARLGDFGIARAAEVAAGTDPTEPGLALGTPAYMSPEQATGGRVDGRTDVYALGCLLYEMLAGEPPFTGPTSQAIVAKHLLSPVPLLTTVRDVPAPVAAAVGRALAKEPADRFATAGEFARMLESQAAVERPATRLPWVRAGAWLAGIALLTIAATITVYRAIRPHLSTPRRSVW